MSSWALSFAMRYGVAMGGRWQPPGFHVCAFLGAWLAGLICARMFGRNAAYGIVLTGSGAVLMTLFGAATGAMLLSLPYGTLGEAVLGLLALVDAS